MEGTPQVIVAWVHLASSSSRRRLLAPPTFPINVPHHGKAGHLFSSRFYTLVSSPRAGWSIVSLQALSPPRCLRHGDQKPFQRDAFPVSAPEHGKRLSNLQQTRPSQPGTPLRPPGIGTAHHTHLCPPFKSPLQPSKPHQSVYITIHSSLLLLSRPLFYNPPTPNQFLCGVFRSSFSLFHFPLGTFNFSRFLKGKTGRFHSACFNCKKCKVSLSGRAFFEQTEGDVPELGYST